MNSDYEEFDVAVIGGGPCGATAANDLAGIGYRVLMLDRDGRIKPCGGAVPPKLLEEFAIPDSLLEARVTSARMISPKQQTVDMPIGGFVGMVDRCSFDNWLRERAARSGVTWRKGRYIETVREDRREGRQGPLVRYRAKDGGQMVTIRARVVVGADGATSVVARQNLRGADRIPHVFAYHEIVNSPHHTTQHFDPRRCDVYYQGSISPDFYGWVFPHGERTSIGMGTAIKGFSLRGAVQRLRASSGLQAAETVRSEGAPIPLRTLRRWDNGRDCVVAGDAAGAVAPSSGEGIYYAMSSGRYAANAVGEFLESGNPRALRLARRHFMRAHGRVFWILGIMQRFWYSSDKRREKFVKICRDPDVQRLTWEAYMNKRLVRAKPVAHVRIFFKDLAHLMGISN